MHEDICRQCECCQDDGNGFDLLCTIDPDDIVPIVSVCQCGEADRITEEVLGGRSKDNDSSNPDVQA